MRDVLSSKSTLKYLLIMDLTLRECTEDLSQTDSSDKVIDIINNHMLCYGRLSAFSLSAARTLAS